jgi:hypothetical protein
MTALMPNFMVCGGIVMLQGKMRMGFIAYVLQVVLRILRCQEEE